MVEITGTGRPVDVFLMPVAPTPAPAPGKVRYFGENRYLRICAMRVKGVADTKYGTLPL